jgi:hypothetical protein
MIVRGVVAVVAALALAPAAHAASATSVVMLSDSGDYIGGGVPRLYHPRNAQISVSGSTAYGRRVGGIEPPLVARRAAGVVARQRRR